MKKKAGLLSLMILLIISSTAGNRVSKSLSQKKQDDSLRFIGVIAEKYPFTMVFKLNGDIVNGWYSYDSKRQRINIIGTLKDESFEITEYTGKDSTGFFSGSMKDQQHINGNWRKKRASYDDSKFFEAIEKKYSSEMNTAIALIEKNKATQKIKIISTNKDGDLWLNDNYIKHCKEQVRAILAFYSTQAGTDCWWSDDHPNKGYSNLSCKFTKTLGLGFQCSDTQLNFIKKWFPADLILLDEADNCYSAPYTATVQSAYNELFIEILADKIVVKYEITGVNMREDYNWTYKGIGVFKLFSQKILRDYYK